MNREVAIVTGAGSGIGAATARTLASRGASVAVLDLLGSQARAVAGEINSAGGVAIAIEMDVRSDEDVRAGVARALGELGPITTVVSGAGVYVQGTTGETDDATWSLSLDVNLNGPFRLARATLPSLLQTKGSFCAVSSDSGYRGAPSMSAYTAAKHGVLGLVRSMAIDYGPRGVRTNALCPGTIDTPMLAKVLESDIAPPGYWESTIPLRRYGRAQEMADVIAHLTSSSSSYTNGHIYVSDGGSSAGYFATAIGPSEL